MEAKGSMGTSAPAELQIRCMPMHDLTAAELARAIFDRVPRHTGNGGQLSADVFALLLLLEEHSELTVRQLQEATGVGQATASELIARAQARGMVQVGKRVRDGRVSVISLTAKAMQWRRRSRERQAAAGGVDEGGDEGSE